MIARAWMPALVLLGSCCAWRVPPAPPALPKSDAEAADDTDSGRGAVAARFLDNSRLSIDPAPPNVDIVSARPLEDLKLPGYPPRALAAGAAPSTVAVRLWVDRRGRVSRITPSPIAESSPGPFAPDFLAAVMAAVQEWEFASATRRRFEWYEVEKNEQSIPYKRVVAEEAITTFYDVGFEFRIVGGRGEVREATPGPQ